VVKGQAPVVERAITGCTLTNSNPAEFNFTYWKGSFQNRISRHIQIKTNSDFEHEDREGREDSVTAFLYFRPLCASRENSIVDLSARLAQWLRVDGGVVTSVL
jgi:hypothetical protein